MQEYREEKPKKVKQGVLHRGVLPHKFLVLQNGERFSLETCKFCIFPLEHFSGEELQPRIWRTPSANVANECWAVPSSWLSSSVRDVGDLLQE